MSEFLVEAYVPRAAAPSMPGEKDFLEMAAELADLGTPIRYVASVFVPEDETCFYLFEAASEELVREAATRSGLQYARVVEAVSGCRDWSFG